MSAPAELAEYISTVKPPAADAVHPLLQRLVDAFGAAWVDAGNVDAWIAGGGDRVLLFAGDPVRFPEGLDVAVVLPELQACYPGRFVIGVARRPGDEALARRFGSQRWPSLMFFRDGQYVTVLPGMHDWTDFVAEVGRALALPPGRAPTVGIPVVAAGAAAPGCH
ncbi:hydrogenase [Piscinibacter sakaiensis]|uniref:Hydrogenase maturation factor HoxO/HyaE n=1 Tax=Piscinibacter sakaiensis TaxID=1547922 RepID=A0A0K8P9G4_PISS1|nr:hydrogenase [Piscinibacter sakaiensis]GAP38820.1 hydrogenase maturation factor HoxO/HyaE [Piscinibacter sakaiensis]